MSATRSWGVNPVSGAWCTLPECRLRFAEFVCPEDKACAVFVAFLTLLPGNRVLYRYYIYKQQFPIIGFAVLRLPLVL